MFRANRRKIREVEVEVVMPGGGVEIAVADVGEGEAEEPSSEGLSAASERPAPVRERPATRAARSSTPAPLVRQKRRRKVQVPKTAPEQTAPEAAVETAEPVEPPGTEDPPLVEETAPRIADTAAAPAPAPTGLTCDIVFWRGYRKAAFYARVFDETGEPLAVAESAFFRSHGNGSPERTGEAEAAYNDLRARLIRDGWQPVGAGGAWYEETFRRDLRAAREPAPE